MDRYFKGTVDGVHILPFFPSSTDRGFAPLRYDQVDEAFGDFDDEAIRLVPVESLGDPELIVPGLVFSSVPGETPDGRNWRVTDVAEGMAVLDANHPLAGWSLKFEVKVLSVSKPEGEVTGNDEVVVPGFLGFAEKIIDDETD